MLKNNAHILSFNDNKKIKILFYNSFFDIEYPKNLSIKYPSIHFFFDKDSIWDVEVVVFHMPSLEIDTQELKKLKKKLGQLWVYWSFECDSHFPQLQQADLKSLFEIKVTYQIDADISLPYIAFCKRENWRQPPKEKKEFINAFFSSSLDKSGRYNLLHELMSKLPVHSYGSVFNNMSRLSDPYLKMDAKLDSVLTSIDYKRQVISKYKFTLAFENAIAQDYVTEKFFQPLILGSVPIYLGAPNVDDFAPGDNCFINASSFTTVNELIDYINFLNNNQDKYNELLKWKDLPLRDNFKSKMNLSDDIFEMLPIFLMKNQFSFLNGKFQKCCFVKTT